MRGGSYDPGAEGQGEAVEGAHADGIGEVAEHLEGDAGLRPLAELIRPVGHQEVMAALVKLPQRLPPVLRLVGGDQLLEKRRNVVLGGVGVDEARELSLELRIAREIEPGQTPPRGFLAGDRGPATRLRLLDEGEHRPGHGTPGQRRLSLRRVEGARRVDVDHGCDEGEADVGELLHLGLGAEDLDAAQPVAALGRGGEARAARSTG